MSSSTSSQKSEVKSQKFGTTAILLAAAAFACLAPIAAQSKVIRVPLEYRAPGDGKPTPNFSPKGTQVHLTEIGSDAAPIGLPYCRWFLP